MGSSSSRHEERPELTHAIQDDNLEQMSGLLHEHPALITAKLDKSNGSNPIHMAVLSRHHQSLTLLLSYVTDISKWVRWTACHDSRHQPLLCKFMWLHVKIR